MRRRHRRLVEEAIRNGTYVPPERPKKKSLGAKPILHDVYLGEEDVDGVARGGRRGKSRDTTRYVGSVFQWDNILVRIHLDKRCDGCLILFCYSQPVSVTLQHSSELPCEEKDAQVEESSTPDAPSQDYQNWMPPWIGRLSTIFHRSRSVVPAPTAASPTPLPMSAPVPSSPTTSEASTDASKPQVARAAVLIAMPSPPISRARSSNARPGSRSISLPGRVITLPTSSESPEELPHIEFGIAEVPMRGFEVSDKVGEKAE